MFDDKDEIRNDLGDYPEYLYDDNIFNDVSYILNRDVIFDWCLPAYKAYLSGKDGGVADFDMYSNWMEGEKFGAEAVLGDNVTFGDMSGKEKELTEEDKAIIYENITQNVIQLAEDNPNTTFYYFFTPYSIAWYAGCYQRGELERQLNAEAYATSMMLKCDNIKLFSFNNETEIITNLNNYKDSTHYGEWINSWILESMKEEYDLLTPENCEEYLDKERNFYLNYEYKSLYQHGK